MSSSFNELANLIWSVADLLRGDYKQSDYGKVILPLTLLRRMDCVIAPHKAEIMAATAAYKHLPADTLEGAVCRKVGVPFFNTSPFVLQDVLDDPSNICKNMQEFVGGFSTEVLDVFERFKFLEQLKELDSKGLLFLVTQKFVGIDLHPDTVSNAEMGSVFEELIRRFSEASNETAGEHYTPREVVRLLVHCLVAGDEDALAKQGAIRSMYDPTAGTGGILSEGEHLLKALNPSATVNLYGQELNPESYAVCKADLLLKGHKADRIKQGNTLSADAFENEVFDYCASNPPFGVDWKKVQDIVKDEHKKGFAGRFGPGLPRVSDGSMLFLLHLISKMRPAAEGGGRIAIILNGSPLFTGDAGSGESEIRRWILENDLLETIIALPGDLFYNTGIATYIWVLSNHKREDRKNKVQLIDATRMYAKMKKSLGNKRVYLTEEQIAEIVRVYGAFQAGDTFTLEFKESAKSDGDASAEAEPARVVSKVYPTTFFGYRKVTVDRPPGPGREIKVKFKKGQKPYDPDLRDTENIPLGEDITAYMKREVLPHVPDAYLNEDVRDEKDGKVGKVGYEINFNRYFYVYKPPRPPEVIAAEIKAMEAKFLELMKGVVA